MNFLIESMAEGRAAADVNAAGLIVSVDIWSVAISASAGGGAGDCF